MNDTLTIASRGSKLALWQAHFVKDQLTANGQQVAIQTISTKGDRVQDRFLHEIGGKGLFIRELEAALLAGDCQLAVHSLKDLPARLPEGFQLAAVLPRHASHDVLVLNPNKHGGDSEVANVKKLDAKTAALVLKGFTIGTSSLRRRSLLTGLGAGIETIAVRGNVDTRIEKLKASKLDGIILAGASLERLGIHDVTAIPFDETWFIPCAGQGALAIECPAGPTPAAAASTKLSDDTTAFCVSVEREVLHLLGGDCTMPAGIKVTPDGDAFIARAAVLDYDGNEARASLTAERSGQKDEVAEMAGQIFKALQDEGAATIISRLNQSEPPQFPLL